MADSLYDASKDEQFRRPYIDVDEWRKEPVLHHYIHGGFEGTLTRPGSICSHRGRRCRPSA